MEFKFKYWGNSGGNLYVQDFHCETYCDLRNAVANLIADRPDIDNVEIFRPGEPKPWTSIFNIRQKMHNRQ